MTIVRSISPEAKAIYKMRRENLKQISRVLQLQMKSGAADFDSVNEDAAKILTEAATVAEQRVSSNFPDLPQGMASGAVNNKSRT